MAAISSRALLIHRLTEPSNYHHKPPPCHYSHHLLFRPLLPYFSTSRKRSGSAATISCRISGVDGGGVFDDFLSANLFYREFAIIGNMLMKIEPLDISLISKGASESVKDSMKRMISTMLGLFPSDQFSVTIEVSKRPLIRLLTSSLITGYTLWNAEYRIMLMKNFESSQINMKTRSNLGNCNDVMKDQSDDSVEMENCSEELERLNLKSCLADLFPDAMNYIQELESELYAAKKVRSERMARVIGKDAFGSNEAANEQDLQTQKQETMQIGYAKESNNDILNYMRSLDSDMLNELSRPSSSEVKGILQQLVHCISSRVFNEHTTSSSMGDSDVLQENYKNDDVNFCETRDYLAKLLFWCMLLGHQLRGLENRLYLRRAVACRDQPQAR